MLRGIGVFEQGARLVDEGGAVVTLEVAAAAPRDGAQIVDGPRGQILVARAGQVDVEAPVECRRAVPAQHPGELERVHAAAARRAQHLPPVVVQWLNRLCRGGVHREPDPAGPLRSGSTYPLRPSIASRQDHFE